MLLFLCNFVSFPGKIQAESDSRVKFIKLATEQSQKIILRRSGNCENQIYKNLFTKTEVVFKHAYKSIVLQTEKSETVQWECET